MSSDPSREQGIAFGDLDEKLESIDYPATADEIRERFGDHELDLVDGSTTLGEALSDLEDETFESPDDVKGMVKNMVGSDAIGREGYSDRGGTTEQGETDEDSI